MTSKRISLNCIVVDDDPVSLKLMEAMIDKVDSINLISSFSCSLRALDFLLQEKVDLIFLDVEIPELTGLELLKSLDYELEVIIMSVKEQYALTAFDHDATDYLLKPVTEFSRFLKSVNKAVSNFKQRQKSIHEVDYGDQENLFMKVDTMLCNLSFKEILWIEAYGDFVKIHTKEKVYTVLSKFQSIADKLPTKDFIRTHRSFIVRLDKIKNIDHTNLQVHNKIIPISRSWRKELMEKIIIL